MTSAILDPETQPPSADSSNGNMLGAVVEEYGKLEIKGIPIPEVDADRVLVRVRASSVNPAELHAGHGSLIIRATSGWRRPKQPRQGTDCAGVVTAVGANVSEFKTGDEVFGGCPGSFAQYTLGGKNLVPKPANVSFEQAGSVAIAGLTALQGLRDKGGLKSGQSVVINGASGGVGTFAIQIAKALGGEVTAVCSPGHADQARALGADHVIDYAKDDFTKTGPFDIVFDVVGNRKIKDLRRALKPEGMLVLAGGGHQQGHGAKGLLAPVLLIAQGSFRAKLLRQRVTFFIANFNKPDIQTLADLMASGLVKPVVDRVFPLSELTEAMEYLRPGHAGGKVVISMPD